MQANIYIDMAHLHPTQSLGMRVRRAALCLAAGLIVAHSAAAQPGDVTRVGPTRAITTISEGVAAVAAGDVLLVDPTTYVEDVSIGKGIAIVVDGQGAVVQGRLDVAGIPAGSQLLISGLDVVAPPGGLECQPQPAVSVSLSRGPVHFQDCEITGATGFGSCSALALGDGGNALSISSAFDVVIQSCDLRGGVGTTGTAGLFSPPGGAGGLALRISGRSQVTLSSSSAVGGEGGLSASGGDGGTAVLLGSSQVNETSSLYAYGSTIRGGDGGFAIDIIDGDGGDGLSTLGVGVEAWLQQCVVEGGDPGGPGFIPGEPGEPFTGSGSLNFLDGTPCTLVVPDRVAGGGSWAIRADDVGVGGEASLLAAGQAAFRFAPTFERPLLVRWPAPGSVQYAPVASDVAGSVTYSFGPTPPPTGSDALVVWTQMICTDASGSTRFSEARATVLLREGI